MFARADAKSIPPIAYTYISGHFFLARYCVGLSVRNVMQCGFGGARLMGISILFVEHFRSAHFRITPYPPKCAPGSLAHKWKYNYKLAAYWPGDPGVRSMDL